MGPGSKVLSSMLDYMLLRGLKVMDKGKKDKRQIGAMCAIDADLNLNGYIIKL